MNTEKILTFGNFQGSVEVSTNDNCFFGRILNIQDVVTYEAETFEKLADEFRTAVFEYLEEQFVASCV